MPVLTPAIARTVRDRIPASTFLQQFDQASRSESSTGPRLTSFDGRLLAYLLTARDRLNRIQLDRIATDLATTDRIVRRAIHRLDAYGLLPNRAAIAYPRYHRARA